MKQTPQTAAAAALIAFLPSAGVFAQTPKKAAPAAAAVRRVLPPDLGPARPLRLPAIRQITLANGLRVVVLEDHARPALWMRLAVSSAGAIRDPQDKVGLAAMTAGLLDQGTTTRTESQIADTIDNLGATLSASADDDYLLVAANGLSAHKDTLFDLLADVTLRPTFPDPELERYRTRTLSSLQAALGEPGTLATAAVNRLVFGSHPYGNFSLGTPATLATITRADVVRFHQENFAPQNATLFLVGDITAAEAEQKAKTAFGGWPRKSVPQIAVPAPPTSEGTPAMPRITIVDRPGAAQTEIRVGVLTPGYKDPNRVAATVAMTVLGLGQFEGRLTREIRVKRGLTYGASSGVERKARAGIFTISTFTKNASTGEVVKIALAEASKLARELTPPAELQARKSFLNGSFAVSVATPDGVLARLVPAVLLGNGPADLTERTKRVEAVTPTQIRQVMQGLAPTRQAEIVLVGDRQAIEKQVAGLGVVRVVVASDVDLVSPTLLRTTAQQTPPVTAAASAPATPEELAAGRALVQATLKAHGGDAFLNIKTLIARGKGELTPPGQAAGGFKLPAESATLTSVAPDKTRIELKTAFGVIVLASPGGNKAGWLDAGPIAGGVRDLPAAFNVGILDFSSLLRAAVQGNLPARPIPAPSGKPVLSDGDNKPLKGVAVTRAVGTPPVQLYVEETTNLLRRVAVDAPGGPAGAGGGGLVILLGNYKSVEGGLLLPGSVRLLTNGVDTLGFTFDTFSVNQPVDDALFQRPAPKP